MLVVNAACKDADLAHLQARLDRAVAIEPCFDRALLALQGPQAAAVLARFAGGVAQMPFLSAAELTLGGIPAVVTRSGYTGEDGFEISLAAADAPGLAERLLAEPEVMPIGLGARDTLRLEAGLCLYGHDIDETTTPVEAGLAWTIGKRRRAEGGFPGAAIVLRQLAEGAGAQARRHPPRRPRPGARRHRDHRPGGRSDRPDHQRRVRPVGRRADRDGLCRQRPCRRGHARSALVVRDLPRPAHVAPLPFVPTRYYRPHS